MTESESNDLMLTSNALVAKSIELSIAAGVPVSDALKKKALLSGVACGSSEQFVMSNLIVAQAITDHAIAVVRSRLL